MSEILVSADVIVPRTVEILRDPVLVMGVTPPEPRVVFLSDIELGYGTVAMWAVTRPEFVIAESELPY